MASSSNLLYITNISRYVSLGSGSSGLVDDFFKVGVPNWKGQFFGGGELGSAM